MLIVPHALQCIGVAFLYFTSFDSLAYYFGFSTTPLKKNNLILLKFKDLK